MACDSSDEASLLSDEGEAMRGAWRRPGCRIVGVAVFGATFVVCLAAALATRGGNSTAGTRLEVGRNALLSTENLSAKDVPKFGTVEAMYTYGAPATAQPALANLLSKDGCFEGLRMYNEDVVGPATTQVDAAAISNSYPHARIDTAVMHKTGDSKFVPCRKGDDPATQWPNDNSGQVFGDWRLHWENDYTPRLVNIHLDGKNVSMSEPFLSAYDYVLMAYKSYDSTAHTVEQVHERLPSWRMVARETRIHGLGTLYDEDPVAIFQDTKSLDCALVFTGTNVDNEITTSTTSFAAGYCGFDQVHDGYRNELWSLAHDLFPRLRPKLSKCSKVVCVGHSLGGALCEIFTACANSQRFSDPDYQNQMWARGTPEVMPEISVGGTFYVEGAEHRCEEPPCPKTR